MTATSIDWVTVKRFAELTGYGQSQIRIRISRGSLLFGVHWKYDPEGSVMLCVSAFNQWVRESTCRASTRGRPRSRSISLGADDDTRKRSFPENENA